MAKKKIAYCVTCRKPVALDEIKDVMLVRHKNERAPNKTTDFHKGRCPECNSVVYMIAT